MTDVSVIIPVYNTEKYLEECLNSILTQSLKEIEIVVVNDASPEELSSLYEQARYGREEPDESAAEKLRREVRA